MSPKTVFLKPNEQYITLQSLLKVANVVSTGGMVKVFLLDNEVLVNGTPENRRGRKLYSGDEVKVSGSVFLVK